MQHSPTFNLQMNNIILGFSDNNRLVYDETEKQFLNFGSSKVTEGLTQDRALVLEKVKTYINENSSFMTEKLSSQLKPLLEKRIRVVNSCLYSFFQRFFLWLMNKSAHIKNEEHALLELKISLDQIKLPASESPLLGSPLSPTMVGEENNQVLAVSSDEFRTPAKKPLSKPPTPYKSPLATPSQLLKIAPMTFSDTLAPPPPPLIQEESHFVGEPELLPFHKDQFQQLNKEEVEKQIKDIDLYVTTMKIILDDVQKLIKEYDDLINKISEAKQEIRDIQAEQSKYDNIIFGLNKGIKNNESVILTYSPFLNSTLTSKIPYIPEQRFENIKKRHYEIYDDVSAEKKEIQNKYELLKTTGAKEEEELLKEELESEMKRLDKKIFNIHLLTDVYKASDCKKKIESRLERFQPEKENFIKLQELLHEIEVDETRVLEINQGLNGMFPLGECRRLLKLKTEEIKKWEEVKLGRVEFLKRPKEKDIKSNDKKVTECPLVEEFPELILLEKLPFSVTATANINTGATKSGIYDKLHYIPNHQVKS